MSNLLIETPENLTLQANIAGFASRFLAALIDYLLIFIVLVVMQIIFRPNLGFARDDGAATYAILFVFQFLIITFYHLFFEFIMNGSTPGKKRLGLRVVQSNGLPVTTSGLLIRNFMRLFDFIPFAYGVGMIAMFATENTQRLGDLAARTVVIYEAKNLSIQSVRQNYSVNYELISRHSPLPDYVRIERLSADDYSTIVNFLRRRHDLKAQRSELAYMLARRLITRMDLGDNVPNLLYSANEAEKFLEQVAYAFEIRSLDAT